MTWYINNYHLIVLTRIVIFVWPEFSTTLKQVFNFQWEWQWPLMMLRPTMYCGYNRWEHKQLCHAIWFLIHFDIAFVEKRLLARKLQWLNLCHCELKWPFRIVALSTEFNPILSSFCRSSPICQKMSACSL